MKTLRFIVIGAGSRGTAYARAITSSHRATIFAVAEPIPYKRRLFGQKFIWGENNTPRPEQEFDGWEGWITYEKHRRSTRISGTETDGERDGEGKGEGVDGVIICTLDSTHITILSALSSAGLNDLHVLCEKPLALSLDDCLSVYASRVHPSTSSASNPNPNLPSGEKPRPSAIFSIGHVLRYSPHNLLLRRLVREQKAIGEIVSVEHVEPVGYWHFAHSYVRGNWRHEYPFPGSARQDEGKGEGEGEGGDGSLLTKSCHDIDFLLWLIEAPVIASSSSSTTTSTSNESIESKLRLRSISSTGHLTQFQPQHKPPSAGTSTNCLSCPIERSCIYSAVRIYRDNHLYRGERGWPLKIVCPDIEDYASTQEAESYLLSVLGEDYDEHVLSPEKVAERTWYGRCVWECDNDVCDDQVVTLSWDHASDTDAPTDPSTTSARSRKSRRGGKGKGGITALFHMISPTEKQCERRGRIYGTTGEITYDSRSISIYSFDTNTTEVIDVPKQPPEEEEAHGGGDYGLARGFVSAVDAVVNRGWSIKQAQREFVGCDLEDVIRSHAVVFAAEEARRAEKVIRWGDWWEGKLKAVGLGN